jgi:hypothetical protein
VIHLAGTAICSTQAAEDAARAYGPIPETSRMGDRVFTGDTLLIRGTGRTDLQNGDPRAQYDSPISS